MCTDDREKNVLSTDIEATPNNVYQKNPQPLSECIIDSETKEVNDYLIKSTYANVTDTRDCPDVMEIWGPSVLKQKVQLGKKQQYKDAESRLMSKRQKKS